MQTFSTPRLTDALALDLAQLLSGALGQPVNFERHPAGNTITGAQHVARARPDGHTLLFVGSPTITIHPALRAGLPFDPRRDLAPVAAYARMPLALIASTRSRVATVRQMIARAAPARARVNYAALGDASTAHLAGELFRAMSGLDFTHVNYNGAAAALNAVVAGEVDFWLVPLPAALASGDSGSLKLIAVSSPARHAAIPNVPTVSESGVPGFDAESWFGVFTTVGTPPAVVGQINGAVRSVLREDLVRRTLNRLGLSTAPGTPADFRALIEKDSERWSRLLKSAATAQ
jgi:tripartite-type tricarboxylate transporter receptor subunit TctC